jgi:hypothetical protein
MERGLTMLVHSVMISLIAYIVMVYLLKQSPVRAENRSILIGASFTIYMILFGHGLPTSLNEHM